MVMIALPPFLSEIAAALVAAVVTLTAMTVKRRPTFTLDAGHDVEREIAHITNKVRHPLTYWVRNWLR